DQVTEPTCGRESLGERTDESHRAVIVHAWQWICGPAFVAKLAVVVVFDDDRAQITGARQQCLAATRAHRHTERKLMCRGDIDETRAIGNLVNPDPFCIDRYADDICALRAEQLPRWRIERKSVGEEWEG